MTKPYLLTINGGSSSIKFALYDASELLVRRRSGMIERIGLSDTKLTFTDSTGKLHDCLSLPQPDYASAVKFLVDWLEQQEGFDDIRAIGHRVVHGMQHIEPELVTDELINELHQIIPFDPEHLPFELALIKAFRQRLPTLPQFACFDTAFHRTMPRVATLLPIPRRYADQGVQRYGFHGLSYAYLVAELKNLGDPAAAKGCVIMAHLGNGASLAALRDGQCIDTSMGFTPTSGIMMGTRTGDIDPGLLSFLAHTEKMTPAQFLQMVNHESGMLGVSEISADMRDLLAQELVDERAAEAVELFCYGIKKQIGAYAAALGGLNTLVFAGGIGENSAIIRKRICTGLEFLGITLDEQNNCANSGLISQVNSPVTVRVIRTDEALMIARSLYKLACL